MHKNGYDGFTVWEDAKNYAVFDPNQIKSATGNSGAFSPINKDIRGYVGSRSELAKAKFDKFMGKEITPQMEAMLKQPKTIEEMRTQLERLAPADQSAMIERLRKIYGHDWKDYAPLFGTLGIGAAATGGGLTAYEILNRRNK